MCYLNLEQYMNQLQLSDVTQYVEENIGWFHKSRIDGLNSLKLRNVLKKKNPYLFKAKHVLTSDQIVRSIMDAFMSSKEEAVFGNWLEGLAIFINEKVYDGRKSGIPGIDLEFDNEEVRYIVSIKSGPSWGNDSQIKKLIDNFNSARRILKTSGAGISVVAVNGCCYGTTTRKNVYKEKGDYYKYCGQKFWEFISGEDTLYKDLVEPLSHQAQERNEDFVESYSRKINLFTKEFTETFCHQDGSIDWRRIVELNSKATV